MITSTILLPSVVTQNDSSEKPITAAARALMLNVTLEFFGRSDRVEVLMGSKVYCAKPKS